MPDERLEILALLVFFGIGTAILTVLASATIGLSTPKTTYWNGYRSVSPDEYNRAK